MHFSDQRWKLIGSYRTVADEHRHDLNREVEDCLTHRLGLSGDVGRVVSP